MTKKTGETSQNPSRPAGKTKPTVRLGTATVVALSGIASYQALHAIAASANIQIIAKLIRAIELTVRTTMDFGTLAMTVDRAGQATIDPEVNRLFIESEGSLSLAGGKPTAGRMLVKGAEFPVAISIEDLTVKLTNGTNSVTVSNFNLMTAQGGNRMTFTPTNLKTFSLSVPVGATLKTRAGQISGTYVGSTRIFASYQ